MAEEVPVTVQTEERVRTHTTRRRVNTDETRELVEGEEQHVNILKDTKGHRSREEAIQVCFSKLMKAPQLSLSEDRLSVTGQKGFSTVLATHGVYHGTWYCEFNIVSLGKTGHVRLGFCTKKVELQAPAGFDEHGYSFRDIEGSKVHNGRREPYALMDYKEGDTVGALIHLPEGGHPIEAKSKKMVRYKGEVYYEEEPEKIPSPLEGSHLEFSINGRMFGEAFTRIMEGTWYPSASLYSESDQDKVTVAVNFGPEFKFPPPQTEARPWRPFSDVFSEEKKAH